MKNKIVVILAVVVVGIFFWQDSMPSLGLPLRDQYNIIEAWDTFQTYLKKAKAHDLAGVRALSHQVSATCSDPAREQECFALMDNVYNVASFFKVSDFKYIESDERQTIIYTDGPVVTMLFFTKDAQGKLKLLGMKFCPEDLSSKCVETDPDKRDEDKDGWWDSVESIFYPTQ